MIVFGSEYRTAPGTVKPGIPAHKLLLGGPAAIAVAPAGLRDNPSVSVNTIGVIDEGDPALVRRPRASPRHSAPRSPSAPAPATSTCSSSARAPSRRPGK